MFRLALVLTLVGVNSQLSFAAEPGSAASATDIRAAIERSLPFVKREGVRWIEKRKCVSCHQVPFMIWSLNAAADRGIKVDPAELQQWNRWATNWQNFSAPANRAKRNEQQAAKANVDTIYQLLIATSRYRIEDSELPPSKFWADHLLATQEDNGSWRPCGQLPSQRRPARETREVSTMWTLIALSDVKLEPEAKTQHRDRATAWLASAKPGQSTEWWTTKLLLETETGLSEAADETRKKLLALQHKDGGWGWLTADKSDAFGTGLAIYALRHSGLNVDEANIKRASRFLVTSQADDGSWKVSGTKKKAAGRVTATATYWGTCWAVIGLAETLPDGNNNK